MTFWIVLVAVGLAAGLWLARSFLRRGGVEMAEGELAMSIYRDQIDAVRRDAGQGLISDAERAAAEREIEARALRAARDIDNSLLAPHRSRAAALGIGIAALAGSGLLYGALGTPGAPDQPLDLRRAQMLVSQAEAGDPAARVSLAADQLADAPDRFEKWWALARAHMTRGDYAAAAEAYRKAAEASDDRPSVLSAYAEALTLANGHKVPSAAKIIFGQVLARQPLDLRARYYTALAKAQDQDYAGALSGWLGLYRQAEPGAPWAPTVRRDIINMARFTRTPLDTVLPDATAEEIARAASPPSQDAAPDGHPGDRVAELEAALSKQPKNFEMSIELAQLYAASGATDKATAVLEAAKAQYPGAPFVQQRLAETARDLAPEAGRTATRGPSEADVAAAATMTEDERSDMIRGMVEGLATRLETQPDDINGWLMLIRSYAVLKDADQAASAAKRAYAHFDGQSQPQAAIRATAAEFGIPLL